MLAYVQVPNKVNTHVQGMRENDGGGESNQGTM
jgi:hypothetical protein